MRKIILDAGAFIAAERHDHGFAAFLKAADDKNAEIFIPMTVIADIWRAPARRESQSLMRAANAIVPLDDSAAREVGILLARAQTKQFADAHVVTVAIAKRPSIIATSDAGDRTALLHAAGVSHGTRATSGTDVVIRPL